MKKGDTIDDPRRRLLVEVLTLGFLSGGIPARNAFAQDIFGAKPKKLPAGQSIYRITGTASVNGAPATPQTQIRPGDTVETAKNSEIVFVVGSHSMLLRSDTRLVIESAKETSSAVATLISGLRLITGKLLSVSRGTPMRLGTAVATIGIRGTGFYAESDPEQTYFCTCYGTTDVSATRDPQSRVTVAATHHDRPLYILGKASAGKSIREAPFINHTDQELMLIETLVGRSPPFVFPKDDYTGPRRDY